MVKSNEKARNYFLDLGYQWVAFKPHGNKQSNKKNNGTSYTGNRSDVAWSRKSDGFGTKDVKDYYTDHFNVFDGYMVRKDIGLVWFQVKTNAWAKKEPIIKRCNDTKCPAIVINVTDKLKECKGKWKVFSRSYNFE